MVTFRYINDGRYQVLDSTGHIGEIVKSLHPRPSGNVWVAYDQNTYEYDATVYPTLADAQDHFGVEGG